jgi:hypothetical protein
MLRIVNMVPGSRSGESNQDSEPNIAVDPTNALHIVATAFTPDPAGGSRAPIFTSVNGGLAWQLNTIVPGGRSTGDITVSFASRGGTLYAGILRFSDSHLNILRTADPFVVTPMTVLVDRDTEDQPWVSAGTVRNGAEADQDRVYVGHNDFNVTPRTASVELSINARGGAAPAGFGTHQVDRRDPDAQDGPPVRTAFHPDGTIYAAFHHWSSLSNVSTGVWDATVDVVVVRDDDWGRGNDPFSALTAADGLAGVAVATDRFVRFTTTTGPLGQDRIGGDLAVAVDPTNSSNVYVAWCDRVGGAAGTDWTIHVRHSTDRGQTWSADVRTITNAKNPAIAINDRGRLAFLFQQLDSTGAAGRWVTQLELTADSWATAPTNLVLHTALSSVPARNGFPFLGDYVRLLTVGNDFYGVFSGNNTPNSANFPNGVTYQRNANWTTQTLLALDNITSVPVSIDPFFFYCSDGRQWIHALYADLLGRVPDAGGLAFWIGRLNAGQGLRFVADGFLQSQEYCTNIITGLYHQLLSRTPDAGGLASWVNMMQNGTALQEIILGFCDSAEYQNNNPVPEQFVESLYGRLLGRASDPGGKQSWIDELQAGRGTAHVINGFLTSQEYCDNRVREL